MGIIETNSKRGDTNDLILKPAKTGISNNEDYWQNVDSKHGYIMGKESNVYINKRSKSIKNIGLVHKLTYPETING